MVPLRDVRLVAIQFSFSNRDIVPPVVRRRNRETPLEHVARKVNATGKRVIEPTEKVSLEGFIADLEAAGFQLVDAFCQARPTGENLDQTYHTVRFLFAGQKFAASSGSFRQVRDTIRTELQEMLRSAFWRVRAFLNPFYQNGEEVPGQRALSINLEARVPRFHPDGSPVTARRKDANGKKFGDPQPLQPDFRLAVAESSIELQPIEVN